MKTEITVTQESFDFYSLDLWTLDDYGGKIKVINRGIVFKKYHEPFYTIDCNRGFKFHSNLECAINIAKEDIRR